ncbi:MAG: hypothetical protein ACXWXF_03235, partial [Aeromicrobium sp.]
AAEPMAHNVYIEPDVFHEDYVRDDRPKRRAPRATEPPILRYRRSISDWRAERWHLQKKRVTRFG